MPRQVVLFGGFVTGTVTSDPVTLTNARRWSVQVMLMSAKTALNIFDLSVCVEAFKGRWAVIHQTGQRRRITDGPETAVTLASHATLDELEGVAVRCRIACGQSHQLASVIATEIG